MTEVIISLTRKFVNLIPIFFERPAPLLVLVNEAYLKPLKYFQ